MRRSEWEDRCKRHPDHRVSRGVCPYCLREKLCLLSASSSATNTTHASSTTSSPYSSASILSSPHRAIGVTDNKELHEKGVLDSSKNPLPGHDHVIDRDDIVGDSTYFSQPLQTKQQREFSDGLQKSQSLAGENLLSARGGATTVFKGKRHEESASRTEQQEKDKKKKKKKISKLFSKLAIGVSGNPDRRRPHDEDGDRFHSKTMKDKSSKWTLF